MLYNIVLIDSRGYVETAPVIKTIDLTDEEYKKMKELVEDFEDTRMPYFYPQMYIYKINTSEFDEIKDFIEERKDEVVKWQVREEQRKERENKRKEDLMKNKYYGDSNHNTPITSDDE